MPFGRLLKKVVAESGKTTAEIIEECRNSGKKIDKSRFSKILNNKENASVELARELARICNYDENILVLECYIDQAPQEILDVLIAIKELAYMSTLNLLKGSIEDEIIEEVKKTVTEEPLSDFIMEILDSRDYILSSSENDFDTDLNLEDNNMKLSINNSPYITVKDNSMFPLIQENMKILFRMEEKYNINDILFVKIKKTEETKIRYVVSDGKRVQLIPINKNYSVEVYKNSEILILGRVNKIITEI